MTPEEKARELVNQYYGHSRNQLQAIETVERVILTRMCQDIDSLHSHLFFRNDFDFELTKSEINQLKNWQEVAYELQNMKRKISA